MKLKRHYDPKDDMVAKAFTNSARINELRPRTVMNKGSVKDRQRVNAFENKASNSLYRIYVEE